MLRESTLNDPTKLYSGGQLAVLFLVAMPAFPGRPGSNMLQSPGYSESWSQGSLAPPVAVKAVRAGLCPPPKPETQNKHLQFWFTATTAWWCMDYMQAGTLYCICVLQGSGLQPLRIRTNETETHKHC